jgi:hypothetical protein
VAVGTVATSMLNITALGGIKLQGFTVNCTNGSTHPYTAGGIVFSTLGSFTTDWGELFDVWVLNNSAGPGIVYGANRGSLTTYHCVFNSNTIGAVITGSDSVWYHPTFGFNTSYGFELLGSMTRIHAMDNYLNQVGGKISISQQTINGESSFDQNTAQGLIVDTASANVSVSARFTSNSKGTSGSPHIDISAAGINFTLTPGCYFAGLAFGVTNTTNYDVYTNGVAFFDYSHWAGTSSTSGHTDYAGAAVLVPTFANGAAAQLSDTTKVYMVYLNVTTAGTATTLAIGPTSGVANVIKASSVATLGDVYAVRLPAGWYLKWAGTTTAIATQLAVSETV